MKSIGNSFRWKQDSALRSLVFVVGLLAWSKIWDTFILGRIQLENYPPVTGMLISILVLELPKLFAVILVVTKLQSPDVRRSLSSWPTVPQCVMWIFMAIWLSLPEFAKTVRWNYAPELSTSASRVMITSLDLIYFGLLIPLREETIFRGLLYYSIRPWGKAVAFFGTWIPFILMHIPSIPELLMNGDLGIGVWHLVFVAVLGAATGYIIQSTGKLWLCILFHGSANSFGLIGPFVKYLNSLLN